MRQQPTPVQWRRVVVVWRGRGRGGRPSPVTRRRRGGRPSPVTRCRLRPPPRCCPCSFPAPLAQTLVVGATGVVAAAAAALVVVVVVVVAVVASPPPLPPPLPPLQQLLRLPPPPSPPPPCHALLFCAFALLATKARHPTEAVAPVVRGRVGGVGGGEWEGVGGGGQGGPLGALLLTHLWEAAGTEERFSLAKAAALEALCVGAVVVGEGARLGGPAAAAAGVEAGGGEEACRAAAGRVGRELLACLPRVSHSVKVLPCLSTFFVDSGSHVGHLWGQWCHG